MITDVMLMVVMLFVVAISLLVVYVAYDELSTATPTIVPQVGA